jgi:8-oxo-dGTP pyrophosphatase MutT (NUDIX family)
VARRETAEETGVSAEALVGLGFMDYRKSRKRVHCFAGPAPRDADPRPTSWEVDQARFVSLAEARELLHPDQCVFLDRLLEYLN